MNNIKIKLCQVHKIFYKFIEVLFFGYNFFLFNFVVQLSSVIVSVYSTTVVYNLCRCHIGFSLPKALSGMTCIYAIPVRPISVFEEERFIKS